MARTRPTEASLKDEPNAAEFVRSQPEARFFRLEMAVTFAPENGEPIDTFWITTEMRRATGVGEPEPIAWSMKPDRIEDEVTEHTKISFGPQLEIINLGFELGTSRAQRGGNRHHPLPRNALRLHFAFVWVPVPGTWSLPAAMFTSFQRNARSSPSRNPA